MKFEITAKRLSLALSNSNLTQQELADRSKVNKSSISQYMNGSHSPSNISAGKMADVLNVNPVWLMGYDSPMTINESTENADETIELLDLFSMLNQKDKEEVIGFINYKLSNYK